MIAGPSRRTFPPYFRVIPNAAEPVTYESRALVRRILSKGRGAARIAVTAMSIAVTPGEIGLTIAPTASYNLAAPDNGTCPGGGIGRRASLRG